VCSVDVNAVSDAKKLQDIRCTAFSSGRLSRWRFRVREEKREGVWGAWMESMDMKLEDESGDERIELVVEISESERLRLITMVMS
jgi:hypothetical protein